MEKEDKYIEFSHIHRDLIKSLLLEKAEAPEKLNDVQMYIWEENTKLLHEIVEDLEQVKPDPEIILEKGLKCLGKVEARRFVIENMLESLKKGGVNQHLGAIADHFAQIGVTEENANTPPPPPPPVPPVQDSPKDGTFLMKMKGLLNRVTLTLYQVVVNSMRVIPKFIGIKPRIGVCGPMFTLDFEVNLEAESLTVHDFFETLGKNLWSK